jgi:hypothetical protein
MEAIHKGFLDISVDDYWWYYYPDSAWLNPLFVTGPEFETPSPEIKAEEVKPFGPTQPDGVDRGNWIQTMPGKGWLTLLCLYSPLEPFFTKEWRPSIEN